MAINSMTGFGTASAENEFVNVKVEIKSLNGKHLELNTRLPKAYQNKEILVRKWIQSRLDRGSVSFSLQVERKENASNTYRINRELAKYYYDEILSLGFELGAQHHDALLKILELPDVIVVNEEDENLETNWALIEDTCFLALDQVIEFRKQEGMAMGKGLEENVMKIKDLLDQVNLYEKERIKSIRQRLQNGINEFIGAEKADKGRLEEELVYFLEKLDFTEEKSRLRNHCTYFLENLYKDAGGKKLGFISQEMGREINTLGAKAYHFSIQQLVVEMKEELEKMKEMLLNVL